ncbi:MAG: class I SAM-dependent RNA methyltransferase [Saprospiraceae bacterium]|nr:class I SAM-dependent RNA methyltransferase [Saprospiraceae bacterium]
MKFIAKTLEGLEEILSYELNDIGAEDIVILKRAVAYSGNSLLLYKSNLLLRTCLKVLVFMKEFEIKDEEELYNEVKKINWEEYFNVDDTFAIDSVVNSEKFRHANFISLKVKDAIADRFREKYNKRPNVDTLDPTIRINVHIRESIVTISLDSSGRSLHMRGYRKQMVDAPLNEVLAAGMVLMTGWDGSSPLIDPMCGSATILCEAARIALKIPPHSPERPFAFKKWKSFDTELWHMVCKEAENNIIQHCANIVGYDINPKAIKASEENIIAAGLSAYIKIAKEDFFYLEGANETLLIFNPPYDERLKEDDILDFYKHIGDKLKMSFKSCTAWILSGNIQAIKNVGLRPSTKRNMMNGSIPSFYCKFDMYDGSKKQKWQQFNNQKPAENL